MAEIKLTVNDVKTGKSYKKLVDGSKLLGKKIGEKVKGDTVDVGGYEFQITGGSDFAGFPMRHDLEGSGRKKILLSGGPCVRIKKKGMKKRKTVCGNTISGTISQVNLKVLKHGSKKLDELLGKKEAKEESKKEVKEEPKKEEPKKEEKEVKEEKSSGEKSTT